jgi:hypothetical protein
MVNQAPNVEDGSNDENGAKQYEDKSNEQFTLQTTFAKK